jgi:DNA-binding transcriptional ArsR family regulator
VTELMRDRIIALVAERGVLRMTSIMRELGLSRGSAGGHLTWLTQHGKLARPGRGVYIIPGSGVTDLPPRPSRSAAQRNVISRRNTAVWNGLAPDERQARLDAMAAGRDAAARRRNAGKPPPLPPPPRTPGRDLTAGQLARALGLTRATIQHHTARGRVPHDETRGGHYRYSLDEAREALAPFRRPGASGPRPERSSS